jgi:hypothetical protein
MMRTYDPKEFVARSRTNKLSNPLDLTISGLVKGGDDDTHILFTKSPACADWLPIPIDIIQSIQHFRDVACKDHQHPFVRITFKSVDEVRSDLAVFMTLLSRAQKEAAQAHLASSPCRVVHGEGGLMVCCTEMVGNQLEVVCTGMV